METNPEARSPLQRALFVGLVLLLYTAGLVHWAWFYNWGNVPVDAWDWDKEHAYLQVLRDVQTQPQVPYHISWKYHGTDRFLGLPEWQLWPHILLLPHLDNGQFFVVNAWVMFTAGFLACLVAAWKYRLGPAAFTLLVLLINFNGYITSHLSVGHTMWAGYFFVPWFALALMEWVERGPSTATSVKVSLSLLAMLLVGHFHQLVWCWTFFLFFILCNPRWWFQGLVTFVLSGLMTAFRIVPAAIAFHDSKTHWFLTGYPTVVDAVAAFILLRDPKYPWFGVPDTVGWWEYDVYVGLIAFVVLVWFGIALRFSKDPKLTPYRYAELDGPLLLQTISSFSVIYWAVAALPLPLANGERVSARFLIIPTVFVILFAVIRMQRVLEKVRWSLPLVILVVGGLIETAITLVLHSLAWQVTVFHDEMSSSPDIGIRVVNRLDDRLYITSVWMSLAVSLAALMVGFWLLWRRRRR